MARPRLYMASLEDIKKGVVTDVYFKRTVKVLRDHGLCGVKVRAEIHSYKLPRGYEWGVFAGLEEALWLLEGLNVRVYAVPEGTLFRPRDPVMVIEGDYCEFAVFETALLGILRHESSIATKAARIKLAAGDRSVLFFGLRALHPAIAPMADRAAYIGGVDGVAGLHSEKYIGVKPVGTMPHAMIIIFGDPVKAWKAFDESMDPGIPRIALVDTFCDERFESIQAYRALGSRLYGVRLDTPSSRRGDMRAIVEEVRWALDLEGGKDVKIVVSGGLDECGVCRLRDVADAFGVGTSIASPPNIDFSMDIVEVYRDGRWIPTSKRGKLPGFKKLYRCCRPLNHIVVPAGVTPSCGEGCEPEELLRLYIDGGRIVTELPSVEEIRAYVLKQLKMLGDDVCRLCSEH
ncbi:MAG: nicotinate phosphoribosyltransferase [Crenarchaeota archaeon]|nr:nicotinate phosphoribosyltransferase [Thermoproteota archaeon]